MTQPRPNRRAIRRSVPVVAATAGGLVLLANFHTTPAPNGATSGDVAAPLISSESETSSTTTSTTIPASTAPATSTVPTSTTTSGTSVDGPVARNEWGPVQVRLVLEDTRITDVIALRLPGDNSHSAALSREAAPQLREEALRAQSAAIDLVSGATLTSQSYIESLQGALDRAGH